MTTHVLDAVNEQMACSALNAVRKARPSPPEHAADFKNQIRCDGNIWQSLPDKNGILKRVGKKVADTARKAQSDKKAYKPKGFMVSGLGKVLKFKTSAALISGLRKLGIKQTGKTPAFRASSRSPIGPRKELWHQPTFKKLVGPMWQGRGILRYDTPEAHERLAR